MVCSDCKLGTGFASALTELGSTQVAMMETKFSDNQKAANVGVNRFHEAAIWGSMGKKDCPRLFL